MVLRSLKRTLCSLLPSLVVEVRPVRSLALGSLVSDAASVLVSPTSRDKEQRNLVNTNTHFNTDPISWESVKINVYLFFVFSSSRAREIKRRKQRYKYIYLSHPSNVFNIYYVWGTGLGAEVSKTRCGFCPEGACSSVRHRHTYTQM